MADGRHFENRYIAISANKNLAMKAIANRYRVSCAHNRPYVQGIYRPKYYTVTLKSRLRVRQTELLYQYRASVC